MLRALVAALLLANLVFFAWTQGWLDSVVGTGMRGEREPERLRQQVRPEAIRIVSPEAARAAAAAASASAAAASVRACLEAGPFTAAQAAAAVTALKSLDPPVPEAAWSDIATENPGRWTVYMGRYPGPEALDKKADELRRRHLDFEEISAGALAPGLSLSRHDDRQGATDALNALMRQGIHTARVVEESAPSTAHVLRVAEADPALASRLAALKDEPWGPGFAACGKPK